MRVHQWLAAAVLTVSVPALAAAQSGTTGSTGTSATESTNTNTTATAASTNATATTASTAAVQATTADDTYGPDNHWYASGFIGSNFGADANSSSFDFGGSLGYMFKSAIGAEFLAGFAPNFDMQSPVLLADQPEINSYMVNAIGSVPLGADGQWQPYVSGGFGAITLRSDVLGGAANNAVSATFNPDDTRFGGDIGAGVMGFVGGWGIRGDVRYFRASSGNDITSDNPLASSLLSGLDFWRANIGVAVRW
jgi:hypothetical protein